MVRSDRGLDFNDFVKAAANAGTAVRVQAFEDVKDVEVSFLDDDKACAWVHVHDSSDEQCDQCESHSYDELGPVYHN